jgi:hypothetical protein
VVEGTTVYWGNREGSPSVHQVPDDDKVGLIGKACSTYGTEKKHEQGFGEEISWREEFGRHSSRWKDIIGS